MGSRFTRASENMKRRGIMVRRRGESSRRTRPRCIRCGLLETTRVRVSALRVNRRPGTQYQSLKSARKHVQQDNVRSMTHPQLEDNSVIVIYHIRMPVRASRVSRLSRRSIHGSILIMRFCHWEHMAPTHGHYTVSHMHVHTVRCVVKCCTHVKSCLPLALHQPHYSEHLYS